MTRQVFPLQDIQRWGESGILPGYMPEHVQPASLDAVIASSKVHVLPGVMKPHLGQPVSELIKQYARQTFDLRHHPLFPGNHYLVELAPGLNPAPTPIEVSPKSSIGRIDVHVRTMVDGHPGFDYVPRGYSGPVYAIVTPNSFPIVAAEGVPLTQFRFQTETAFPYQPRSIVLRDKVISGTDRLHLNLEGDLVGYIAKKAVVPIDLNRYDHATHEYWDKVGRDDIVNGRYLLPKDKFGIFMTQDKVSIDPLEAAVLHPMNIEGGDLRIHYAGFIDPGFGYSNPNNVVLEIRPYEDVYLQHGEPICHMTMDTLRSHPTKNGEQVSYDTHGTNYTLQNVPRLSKFFKD